MAKPVSRSDSNPHAQQTAAAQNGVVENRTFITLGLILAAFMAALDATVANICLPHVQGSLSASPEQITWVITSYFVAQAVMTPVSGWLASQYGLKPMIITSVFGFTVASMLCGLATNLPELVAFRIFQGMMAAPLMPIAQAVIININPPERIGRAMATFTMAAVIAPAIGPVVGGWLTEDFSWRWCFYINVPAGLLSMAILYVFLPDVPRNPRRFDFLGFAALGLAIAAFQLMLDRGGTLDWFSSTEICLEAAIAAASFWVYITHSLTTDRPLFPRELWRDRNFITSMVLIFALGLITFTSFTILPLMMQGALGYTVMHAGVLSMPRGVIMFACLQVVGRVDHIVDRRLTIALGLTFFVFAFREMTRFDLSMGGESILWASALQGVGQSMVFVPLSALGFLTIGRHLRADGAAFSNLIRSLGGSVGVAVAQALTTSNTQVMHASLAAHIGPEMIDSPNVPWFLSPSTTEGAVALNAEITRQALMVAYVNDFYLLMVITLVSMPIVLIMRAPRRQKMEADAVPMDAHG